MLRPRSSSVGAALQVSLRSLGKHRAGTAAGPLLGASGFCVLWHMAAEDTGTQKEVGGKRAFAFPLSRK